jgi:branched-chain amino acid transport system permease protein
MLRAVREDPPAAAAAGISIYRQRLGAFVLSGLVAGFAGGLEVHLLPLSYRDLSLDLTFLTLAMLVIGGVSSLWGAVVGALVISALDSFFASAENGVGIPFGTLTVPAGTRVIVEGVLMALILIVRPSGLTGGREFSLRWLRR